MKNKIIPILLAIGFPMVFFCALAFASDFNPVYIIGLCVGFVLLLIAGLLQGDGCDY